MFPKSAKRFLDKNMLSCDAKDMAPQRSKRKPAAIDRREAQS
jgi:hypothetical protein